MKLAKEESTIHEDLQAMTLRQFIAIQFSSVYCAIFEFLLHCKLFPQVYLCVVRTMSHTFGEFTLLRNKLHASA